MDNQDDRLATELALLESMYPDQIRYSEKAREVSYRSPVGNFTLRLPSGYLASELPEVLSANAGSTDLRERLKQQLKGCDEGEEVLDSIVLSFIQLAEAAEEQTAANGIRHGPGTQENALEGKATVIVWLHHLLNTNKRKQALSPPLPGVSGVTKPGYPGVLVYSGPATAVHEHVNELKQLNWAAFQVRLESEEEWSFAHGHGVTECEAMKEVVAEVGEQHKEVFLEAMRMK